MKQKLLDIQFVNQAARVQWRHALGRSLTKPEPKRTKPAKPKPEANPLWALQLRKDRDT